MNLFKKLPKVFTTLKNSLSASSGKLKKRDDHTDAMAYLKEHQREAEFQEALRRINPSMISNKAMNAACQQAMWNAAHTTGIGAQHMGAINQAWSKDAQGGPYPYDANANLTSMTIEKVDNGYILRCGKYSKVCTSMDELRDLFVSVMVERTLDK